MGSCISKCRPKRKISQEEYYSNNVQDKLVISQAPISPIPIPIPTNNFLSPPPSISSFSLSKTSSSCLTSSLSSSSSSSSSSSCSSSIQSSKDRSFSNEFLWSCAKDNPHVTRVVQTVHASKMDSPGKPIVQPVKQVVQHKRARASSPSLTRQKSFRKETEKVNPTNTLPSRTLRSPSPSRRFNGSENYRGNLVNAPKESFCKNLEGNRVNSVNSELSFGRKENLRPASPNNNLSENFPNTHMESFSKNLVGNMVNSVNSELLFGRKENLRPASPNNNLGGNLPNSSKESFCKNLGGYKVNSLNSESLCGRKENLRPANQNTNLSGNLTHTPTESCRNLGGYKVNSVNSELLFGRKENLRPASPNSTLSGNRGSLMNRDTCKYQNGSKIDGIAVGDQVVSNGDVDLIPMEDIDNPLISLDCFIFL